MYEKETDSAANVKQYCYIAGGNGVTAILINEDLYFLRRDVQGTITGLIDRNNNLVEEYSYDACLSRCSREGRRRNPTDWTYDSVPQAQYLYRGYTMHEMLDEFGLINMNGRCYDPVVGRFLSPDIIVQNPNNTQCYNRYSYCINNPLKYSDPSGWVYDQSWTHRHNANIVNHNFLDRLWGHNWTFDEKEEWNALIEATGGNSLNNAGEAVDLLEIYGNNLKMDNSLSIFNNSFFTIYVDPEIKEQYEALKEAKQYKLAIELIINTYDLDKNIKASGESVEGLYEIRPVPGYGMVTKSPSQENKYDNSGNRIPYLIEVGIGTLNKETFAYVLFSTFHEILHVYEFEFLGLYGGNMDPRREFLSYANAVLFAAYNFTTCRIDQETFNFWKSQAKSNFNNISDFYILGQNRYRYYNRLLDNMNSTTYQPY